MPAHSTFCSSDPMHSANRKNSKPIMEKRRRARINQYLTELKSLILEAMKKDPARHSKLEKADILEMTVRHLQDVQRQQVASAVSNDPSVWAKFRSGFCECADEVQRYLGRMDGIDSGLKQRLLNYLNICMNSMNTMPSPNMSTFLPSLNGIMPQFHPLAMHLAASIQAYKSKMESQTSDIFDKLSPEDLSNKCNVQSSPSSESSFKSPTMSASTSSEKEFSPRKVNLENSQTQLMFKLPNSGHNIHKPIAKHASVVPLGGSVFDSFPSTSSSDRQFCDSGSEDEAVWRPW